MCRATTQSRLRRMPLAVPGQKEPDGRGSPSPTTRYPTAPRLPRGGFVWSCHTVYGRVVSPVVIDRQITLAHHGVEVGALHADLVGCFADIPVATAQCLNEKTSFQIQHGRVACLLLEQPEFIPRLGNRRDGRPGPVSAGFLAAGAAVQSLPCHRESRSVQ